MRVVISITAETDLDSIQEWMALTDETVAQSFRDELLECIDGLDHWPERFPLLEAETLPGVRRRNYRGYRILYAVEEREVVVLHVHHGARSDPF